jgi:peptidyl-prolyl cis-trans isomerase A (cyclophilin A)
MTPARPTRAGFSFPRKDKQTMAKIKFECSHGEFIAEIHEDWAPRGVARMRELLDSGFFEDIYFFRVVTQPRPFVVQFGIHGDPEVSAQWRSNTIEDDPVRQRNVAGTLTFATAGPNTRTTQFFINLADNTFLDNQGFSPIGRIVEGMEVVEAICDAYGERPNQGLIQSQGNAYIEAEFPKMDRIKRAYILEE